LAEHRQRAAVTRKERLLPAGKVARVGDDGVEADAHDYKVCQQERRHDDDGYPDGLPEPPEEDGTEHGQ
jgi:hypothetical protein